MVFAQITFIYFVAVWAVKLITFLISTDDLQPVKLNFITTNMPDMELSMILVVFIVFGQHMPS